MCHLVMPEASAACKHGVFEFIVSHSHTARPRTSFPMRSGIDVTLPYISMPTCPTFDVSASQRVP